MKRFLLMILRITNSSNFSNSKTIRKSLRVIASEQKTNNQHYKNWIKTRISKSYSVYKNIISAKQIHSSLNCANIYIRGRIT